MAGSHSRNKGARGEREVVGICKDAGIDAQRTAPLQAGASGDADVLAIPGFHLEVKRQERLQLDAWSAQAERDAPSGVVPCVVYRRSRQPWRVSLPLGAFLALAKRAGLTLEASPPDGSPQDGPSYPGSAD